ncbi:hypothetical protein Pcinc_008739 [Petrolisthes cinctipes]|uniref:Uncharacterized protein n=1 Tax=Petrolisthes cinctipes TaxID=88211 RepID=A0AAE1G8C2_PETCI|nr:hypothetical protein Pcinc_008739 [Petrolisthes cinctipes]
MVVAQVLGNDLFLRNGETGNTEEIILDAMYMVDELKRFNRTAVIGILPRIGASSHALSKAIGVNERLEDMCTPLGVRFVDPYNMFYGRADLYLPDGVHLNKRGKEVFWDMVNQVLYRVVRSTHVVREGRQPNDSDAPEVTPIEVTPPLEKRSLTGGGRRSMALVRVRAWNFDHICAKFASAGRDYNMLREVPGILWSPVVSR